MSKPRLRISFAVCVTVLLLALAVPACGGRDEASQVGATTPGSEGVAQVTLPSESGDSGSSGGEAVILEDGSASAGLAQTSETVERPDTYHVGDVVSIGDVTFAVLSWEEVAADGDQEPDPGHRFIAVELFILNRAADEPYQTPLTELSVQKEDSLAEWPADHDFAASLAGGSLFRVGEDRFGQRYITSRDLAAGEAIRCWVGFHVPQDAGALQFVFRDPRSLGLAIVDLGEAPTTVDLPEELVGSTEHGLLHLGEPVSVNDGSGALVVLGWEERAGEDDVQPREGHRFVVVELLLVNMGDRNLYINTFDSMTLRDSEARVYDVVIDAGTLTTGGTIDGSLVVGERVRGEVVFHVPISRTGLAFAYNSYAGDAVHVSLGDVPGTVAPPEELAGAPPLWTHDAGAPVDLGELVVTVHEASSPPASGYDAPDAGSIFFAVDLSIENQGRRAVTISPSRQMALKDAVGRVYDVECRISAETLAEGQLAPGETVRGQVGFQVPAGTEGLMFVFEPEEFGQPKLLVELP